MALLPDVVKAFIALAAVVLAVSVARVSAQTHHVAGGWGPDLDAASWLSGRIFSVGDKIWFKYSGTEESMVELPGLEELVSCNLTNPIKMYTDPASHVLLDKEGPRYFTSGDPERCKNGLKLPINVRPTPGFDPSSHDEPSEFDPPFPYDPPSPHKPFPPVEPTPPYDPPIHERPPPPPPPHEPPVPVPPPPPPHDPSAAAHLNVLSLVVACGLLMCVV